MKVGPRGNHVLYHIKLVLSTPHVNHSSTVVSSVVDRGLTRLSMVRIQPGLEPFIKPF